MSLIVRLLATVTLGLFVVMLVSAMMNHRSRRATQNPTGSLVMELIWSVIPWAIVVAAAMPAVVRIMSDFRADL